MLAVEEACPCLGAATGVLASRATSNFIDELLDSPSMMCATQELRPKIAENAEQLLKEAEEAIPPAAGYRGAKRKKQQRLRWAIIRVGDSDACRTRSSS